MDSRYTDSARARSDIQPPPHEEERNREAPPRPSIAAPFDEGCASRLPEEIARSRRFVGWRFVLDEDRSDWTKVPLCVSKSSEIALVPASTTLSVRKSEQRWLPRGWCASTDKESTWCTLDAAIAAWRAGGLDGIGWVFAHHEDGILGIDLDDVRDAATGMLLPQAIEMLEAMPHAYAEVSPSGTGVKLWARASLPGISSRPLEERQRSSERAGLKVVLDGARLASGTPVVEVFATKYFTVTGHEIEGRSSDLSIDHADQLVAVLDRLCPRWRERSSKTMAPDRSLVEVKPRTRDVATFAMPAAEDCDAMLARVRAGLSEVMRSNLDELWAGRSLPTHASGSEGDWMLARLLVEGGVSSAGDLRRMLLASPRADHRPKWRSRTDYLDQLVAKTIAEGGRRAEAAAWSKQPIASVALPDSGVEVQLSDDGIAAAFIDATGGRLRFDNTRGRWMRLDRGVWRPDETAATSHEVRLFLRRIADLAVEQHRPDPRQEARLRERLGGAMRAHSVESFARRDDRVSVTASAWDRDPMLAGTPDGVLDLATGELRPATGEELITRRLGATPAPRGTDCPRWRQSIHEWMGGDPEMIAFAQRWCGYLLTGSTSEHSILFNYGPPAAGKSRFLWAISRALGDYATTAAMESFTERNGSEHSCELAALAGARLVTASETQEGRYWSDARIKQLSGGDPITARFMRQDPFVYHPHFKLVIAGNYRPRMRNPDPAIGRRLHLVQWTHAPSVRIDLDPLHEAELPAILRWMLDGVEAWLERGLNPPAAVVDATRQYLAEEDEVGHWLAERCEIDPKRADWFCPTATLLHAANDWRASQGDSRPWKARDLSAALATRGAMQSRNPVHHAGGKVRGWFGVRLLDSHEVDGSISPIRLVGGLPR